MVAINIARVKLAERMKYTTFFPLVCIIVAARSLSVFADTPGSQYIGYRHKGALYGERLPNGVRYWGGRLISDENYGVTRFTKGGTYMLWLEKIIYRDDEGTPHWQVLDVLVFERLLPNQEFLYSYNSPCTIGGRADPDLIVMVELGNRRNRHRVLKACRADTVRGRFESVSTQSVKCNR